METHIQQDSSGSISTTWSSFRTAPESVPISPEYTLVNEGDVSGTSALTKFYADIVESTYQTNVVDYFENPHIQDNVYQQVIPTTINYNTNYRRVDFGIDNMKMYVPITENANLPMYIAFRGTQAIYDYYRDLNVVLDYGSSSVLGSFNSEMTTIYNTIKSFIETENRPITILGHSLGAYYALNLLHVLHTQEAPNLDHIESQFKLILFNPLILVGDAVNYFRATEQQTYSKNNIEIHSIRGDFLSPLLIQAGIGKVYAYDNDTVQTIDTTDFLLGTWLTQLLGVTDRNSYLNDDNHKLSTFGGNTNGLESYKLIDPITNDNTINGSIRFHNKMYVRIIAGGSLSEVYTYVWDNANNSNYDKTYIDYPHEDNTHDSHILSNYNWDIDRFTDPTYKYQHIISTYNNQKYINFRRTIKSETANSQSRFRYFVKIGDSATNGEFLLMLDSSTVYKQGLGDIIDSGSVELINENISTYFSGISELEKERYLVDIVLPQADAEWISNRRSNITYGVANTYVGKTPKVKVKFWNQIYSTYYNAWKTYWLAKGNNLYDYVALDGIDQAWVLNPTGDVSLWTGQHVWTLDLSNINPYFDSNYPYLEKLYKIENTVDTSTTNSAGEKMWFQGGPFHLNGYGGPVDSDDRYIEVLNEYPNETPYRMEVRIYAYRNGSLVVYDAVNDDANNAGGYPTVDTQLSVGAYGHPIWYPISQLNATNNNNVWDMLIEP